MMTQAVEQGQHLDLRARIILALEIFINQRPGMEPGNYGYGMEGWRAYRSESRSVTKDRDHALLLLWAVEKRPSITGEDIIAASKTAHSGRLTIKVREDGAVGIDYCTGQYFPTEYRRAAAAVLSQALWNWMRDHCMPESVKDAEGYETYNGMSAGDWLRKAFRKEFGSRIQRRWFD